MGQRAQALLENLAECDAVVRFAPGDIVVREGEDAQAAYLVLAGLLQVFTTERNGRMLVYNTLQPGDMFGEMLLDGGKRSASVRALCASECLLLPGDRLRAILRADPDACEALIVSLISRLRHATVTIRDLAMKNVYERVRALLEELAVDAGEVRCIPGRITQQDIANRIGATREMVNHVFSDLIRGGHIALDAQHRITLQGTLPKRW
jgi:CRP/FNR family cyclic AMP-dependent transcriptional regulator